LPFSQGLAGVLINGRYGFINPKGEVVIPLQFEQVENFSEELAAAKINGRWGYIDTSGKFVIKPTM
jgi:hypothetical protein